MLVLLVIIIILPNVGGKIQIFLAILVCARRTIVQSVFAVEAYIYI
jgi:hypothetical protein